MMINQQSTPITVDVKTETLEANLAASPFPAPSSFATLTLRLNLISILFYISNILPSQMCFSFSFYLINLVQIY